MLILYNLKVKSIKEKKRVKSIYGIYTKIKTKRDENLYPNWTLRKYTT